MPHTSEIAAKLGIAKTIYQPCLGCGFPTGRTLLELRALILDLGAQVSRLW